jgi:hypothetical protein
VSDQLHASAALHLGNELLVRGCVDLTGGLDDLEKVKYLANAGNRKKTPLSACSQVIHYIDYVVYIPDYNLIMRS